MTIKFYAGFGLLIIFVIFFSGILFLISPTLSARILRRYPPGLASWLLNTPNMAIRLLGLCFAAFSLWLVVGMFFGRRH